MNCNTTDSVSSSTPTHRFFTHEGLTEINNLRFIANNIAVREFIDSKLVPYLLSDSFDDKGCLFPVTMPQLIPEELKEAVADGEPVYYVLLNMRQYNKFHMLIEYLNTLSPELVSNIVTVEETLSKFEEHLRSSDKLTEKVFSCSTGYTWYKLLNNAALEDEGIRMGHCSGRKDLGHSLDLLNGNQSFLSLRPTDNDNLSIATLVINNDDNKILEIRGRENSLQLDRYILISLAEVMNYLRLTPETENTVPFNNLVSVDSKWQVR